MYKYFFLQRLVGRSCSKQKIQQVEIISQNKKKKTQIKKWRKNCFVKINKKNYSGIRESGF
jgi:hypothetical protein